MKKRSLKNLELKKRAISKLVEHQKSDVKGGADTLFCQTFFCGFTNNCAPSLGCVTFTCNFTGLSCFGGC